MLLLVKLLLALALPAFGMRPLASTLGVSTGTSTSTLGALTDRSLAHGSAAFDQAVEKCGSTSGSGVARCLRHACDLDEKYILQGIKSVKPIPCRRPAGVAAGYGLFNDELLSLPTEPGKRVCQDGKCCEQCSRVTIPDFASPSECAYLCERANAILPGLEHGPDATLNLIDAAFVADPAAEARSTLLMIRLVERLRRVVAHEYSLPLASIAPDAAFLSRQAACDERGAIHADESSHCAYHYSAVLYLTSQGKHFTGGDFIFVDELEGRSDASQKSRPFPFPLPIWPRGRLAPNSRLKNRQLTCMSPCQGQASVFSSGWENMHFVDAVRSGTRFALPVFFTTSDTPSICHMTDAEASAALRELCLDVSPDEGELDGLKEMWHALFTSHTER